MFLVIHCVTDTMRSGANMMHGAADTMRGAANVMYVGCGG